MTQDGNGVRTATQGKEVLSVNVRGQLARRENVEMKSTLYGVQYFSGRRFATELSQGRKEFLLSLGRRERKDRTNDEQSGHQSQLREKNSIRDQRYNISLGHYVNKEWQKVSS